MEGHSFSDLRRPELMATKPVGSDIVVTTAVELIGLSLLAILAGMNKGLGRVAVVFMAGIALIWAMSHTGFLQKYIGQPKANG
jgi:hypothetical protein